MGSFAASVKDWAERSKKNQMEVVQRALELTLDIPTAVSKTRLYKDGSFGPPATQGFLPVDLGHLVNTRASERNGAGNFAVDAEGPAFSLTIEAMEAGDVAYFAWTAAYALRINYGFTGTDSLGRTYDQAGTHFLDHAAARWPANVAQAAREIKP